MESKDLNPAEIALNRATRSAHMLRLSDIFSTLLPVKMFPSLAKIAAPTLQCEYGCS
ncbi:MAG: hypothetical protein WAZ77_20560 [Candidatus Nitrosopolaris sp.]